MKIAYLFIAAAMLASAAPGLPARSDADQYTAKADTPTALVAAAVIPPDQVRNEFATTLVPRYYVLEVAVYPQNGANFDITPLDFGLRLDGRLIRPADPRTIAAQNQKRGRARSKDVLLYPTVGVSTGSWGAGTNVGLGVGMGGGAPGPASTDQDRRVMQSELEDRALMDRTSAKPVAGYLYFPVGDAKSSNAELIYQYDGGEVKLPLILPKQK
ncbi:MAG TPA: hypothetical protein VER03_21565 [Bryobacteraceae bacterium]|nr:hypothetical protein [Bryobacteraceae bacterium]